MILLLELFASIVRIFLLSAGIIITYFFGAFTYQKINSFLNIWNVPCIEIISYLVLVVPIIAVLYGIHIQKFFWKRENVYNKKVFFVSYLTGIVLSLIPVETGVATQCAAAHTLLEITVRILSTGLITSIFAFIGMDIGVLLKHSSKKVSPARVKKKRK